MKLSVAIKLGAMLRPQNRGRFYSSRPLSVFGDVFGLREERDASCALGAAYEAIGGRSRTVVSNGSQVPFRGQDAAAAGDQVQVIDTPSEWRLLWLTVACPICESRPAEQLLRVIPHLNDEHLLTREEIADWVATLEASQDQPAPAVEVTA